MSELAEQICYAWLTGNKVLDSLAEEQEVVAKAYLTEKRIKTYFKEFKLDCGIDKPSPPMFSEEEPFNSSCEI